MPYGHFSVSLRAKLFARYPTIEDMYTLVEELESTNYSINAERVKALDTLDDSLRKGARLKDRVSETTRFPEDLILVDVNLPTFQHALGQIKSALFLKTREKDKNIREGVDLGSPSVNDSQLAFLNGVSGLRTALDVTDNFLTRESFEKKFTLVWAAPGGAGGGGGV